MLFFGHTDFDDIPRQELVQIFLPIDIEVGIDVDIFERPHPVAVQTMHGQQNITHAPVAQGQERLHVVPLGHVGNDVDLFVLTKRRSNLFNFFPDILNIRQRAPLQRCAGLGNELIDAERNAPEFSFAFRMAQAPCAVFFWPDQ